jgi:hypothetical protein
MVWHQLELKKVWIWEHFRFWIFGRWMLGCSVGGCSTHNGRACALECRWQRCSSSRKALLPSAAVMCKRGKGGTCPMASRYDRWKFCGLVIPLAAWTQPHWNPVCPQTSRVTNFSWTWKQCASCFRVFFFFLFETGSFYIAQAGLKLEILLPQSPECWDYRHVLPHSASLPLFD